MADAGKADFLAEVNALRDANFAVDVPLLERDQIIVGSPLPFSIFSSEGHLLLAAGRIVENEHVKQLLIEQGVSRSSSYREVVKRDDVPTLNEPYREGVLTALKKDYGSTSVGRRFAVTMAPNETHEAYNAWVVGVTEHSILVTAPLLANGSLVAVTPGQVWLCRTFQVTSVFRFFAKVLKVAFEPYPHLHIEVPRQVEKRKIRGRPRASVFLNGTIDSNNGTRSSLTAPCVFVDLSIGGGRVAMDDTLRLQSGQTVRFALKIAVIDFTFDLKLKATVVGCFGNSDGRHPQVIFYGVKFEALNETQSLVLQAFVNGNLAVELNSLWHVLSNAPQSNGKPE